MNSSEGDGSGTSAVDNLSQYSEPNNNYKRERHTPPMILIADCFEFEAGESNLDEDQFNFEFYDLLYIKRNIETYRAFE
jgi:hypothetical protein